MKRISVILIEPEKEENLGRIARIMENFGVHSLVLVNPKCNHLGTKAMALASHADGILRKARIAGQDAWQEFDCLVGTTAILGKDSNMERNPITPRIAARKIAGKKTSIGLVFGRESSGLRNDELMRCDMVVSIPTEKKYSTMNLSQAVGIVLYETFLASGEESIISHIRYAARQDMDTLAKIANASLDRMDFQTPQKREAQKKVWKRVLGKATLTKKEALSLMGFFKKAAK